MYVVWFGPSNGKNSKKKEIQNENAIPPKRITRYTEV